MVGRDYDLIEWSRTQRDSNPLTGLPGNPAIEAQLQDRMTKEEAFAFLYLDLDHFKAYNDYYSYRAGDDVIKLLAKTMRWPPHASSQSPHQSA